MKFVPLTSPAEEDARLEEEYRQAREIGTLRLGTQHLFFHNGWKHYFIPYHDIRRYFRRVMQVPAKLCCGRGNFDMENLVICGDSGELAQIQLPGSRAAKIVMESMAELAPTAAIGKAKPAQSDPDPPSPSADEGQ